NVGAVVQLLASQFPQGDYREVRFSAVRLWRSVTRHQFLVSALIGEFHEAVGQGRQFPRNLRQRAQAEHVAHDDPQNLPASEPRQLDRSRYPGGRLRFQLAPKVVYGGGAMQAQWIEQRLRPVGVLEDLFG